MSGLQWSRHAVVARQESRRVICSRAGSRDVRVVGVCARALPHALHLLPHGRTLSLSLGVEFYPHQRRVEIGKIHMNIEFVLRASGSNLHVAEA